MDIYIVEKLVGTGRNGGVKFEITSYTSSPLQAQTSKYIFIQATILHETT